MLSISLLQVTMPQRHLPSDSLFSSDSSCLKMAALALEADDAETDVYVKLGLKVQSKTAGRAPRFLSLLSSLLETSVKNNEILLEAAEAKNGLTAFHGFRVPPLSIRQYIDRIFKYAGCSPSCFIVAYIYVDRYLHQSKAFLTSRNVHRLLVTSVMVAAKFVDDSFFNNAYYARVGGVSTSEMNRLEMKLLFSIDFRMHVNVETFQQYCLQLEKEAGRCALDQPMRACWVKESWSRKDDSPRSTPVAR